MAIARRIHANVVLRNFEICIEIEGIGITRRGTLLGVPIVVTEVALPYQCDDRGKMPLSALVVGDKS